MRQRSKNRTPSSREPLLSAQFVRVTVATTFYFLAYGTVTPVLPHFVTTNLSGGNFAVGVVVGAFALSAILTRPIAGRLGNLFGRRWLMVFGAGVVGVAIACYGLATDVAALIGLRLVTGVGEGFFYTGSATIVADLAPEARRGEAISLYSVAVWVGNGLGPAIGEAVYKADGAVSSFYAAAGLCFVAFVLSWQVHDTHARVAHGEQRQPLVARRALLPGSILALSVAGTTAFNAYVPLYVDKLGMSGPQYVFLLYAAIVLSVRIFLARLPDRWGPLLTGTIAASSIASGFLIIAAWASPVGLYFGSAVIALGNSFIFPGLMAMALTGAQPRERSPIVGTFSGFFDLASGLGGLTLGLVAAVSGYRVCFATGAAYAAAGLGMLQTRGRRFLAPRAVTASRAARDDAPRR